MIEIGDMMKVIHFPWACTFTPILGSVMIGFETGDNWSFITVSSFGKSLLKQDELFEEAFLLWLKEYQAL